MAEGGCRRVRRIQEGAIEGGVEAGVRGPWWGGMVGAEVMGVTCGKVQEG